MDQPIKLHRKPDRSYLSCVCCGSPVQIFNSQKGRVLVGFGEIDRLIPDTETKRFPKFRTGRVCTVCSDKHRVEILPDEYSRGD